MKESEFTDADLISLQYKQMIHDQRYHADIAVLPPVQIIKHMTLHMSKYLSGLITAEPTDVARFRKTLTDAFIITLATANTLNYALGYAQPPCDRIVEIQMLGTKPELIRMAAYIGIQAKACEAWDHLEDYPFAQAMRSSNWSLFKVIQELSVKIGLNLKTAYHERIAQIENKHIFHKQLATL